MKRALLLVVTCCAAVACVGPGLNVRLDVIRGDIERARASGAYQCAPRELAMAEAHADFTEVELSQGAFLRAQDHMETAETNAKLAIENSAGCGPKKVLIKSDTDKDGDGIPDADDACPEKPEDFDGFVDTDGCPDPDNDEDGILDPLDKCPDEAEDKDNFEDEDGCPEADNDKDSLLDPDDKCPDVAGPVENKGCPLEDKDGDGITDKVDKCPEQPEDMDGDRDEDGCPDVDTDGDGLEDDVDKCPKEPEDKDGFEDEDGCPDIDNDKDGILDKTDACPDVAGPLESRGCPDKDGDGIADKDDKCPDEVGVAQPDNPDRHGCPKAYKLIIIKKDKIEIKQKILFATGKATIKRQSFSLLAEVADAVKSSGNIAKVYVDGHTDDRGSDSFNQDLSERRAAAVRTHLIEIEQVPAEKLESRGYGESKPIASNRTRRGREQNRRVEFNVVRGGD